MTNHSNWLSVGQASLDKPRFIEIYSSQFHQTSYVATNKGLKKLLEFVEVDTQLLHRSWVAYMFATVLAECGQDFKPIEERGKVTYFDKYEKPPSSTWLKNTQPGDGFKYRGRGYCQITGRGHYETFGKLVGLDLIEKPGLALQPDVSYRIMSDGMVRGLFTGVSLSKYLNETRKDFVNARRIINGQDRAQKIAVDAMKFEICLKESERLING